MQLQLTKINEFNLKELGFKPNSDFDPLWQKDDVIYNVVNNIVYLPKEGRTLQNVVSLDQLKKIMEEENKLSMDGARKFTYVTVEEEKRRKLAEKYGIEKVTVYKITTGETFNTLEEAINKHKLALFEANIEELTEEKCGYNSKDVVLEFIIDNRTKLKEIFKKLG